ncbi:MAG TPA: septum formation initiator family protein [Thermoanaerobacterales bacterium]|jgi:cell division protein DivIC|nr:septum formation initiator family protein [Thermoanaerobacterales bacterium]
MAKKRRFKIRHIIIGFFLIYIVFTLISQQFKMFDLSRQEIELEKQLKSSMKQREELKKEIELLHTDEYIEKVARDELGLVKPGELIYKINPKSK